MNSSHDSQDSFAYQYPGSSKHNRPLFTPPEAEPRTPFGTSPRSQGHYFETFGPEVPYERSLAASISSDPTKDAEHMRIRVARTSLISRASKYKARLTRKSGKRSSVIGLVRTLKPESVNEERSTDEEALTALEQSHTDVAAGSPTPMNTIREASSKRGLSPSYFPSREHSRDASDAETSSPFRTNWANVVAAGGSYDHSRETSSPLSPFSLPRVLKRPRPMRRGERHGGSSIMQHNDNGATGETAAADKPHKQITVAANKGKVFPLSGPNALSFLPSEMTRVTTPPLPPEDEKRKALGFKGFFFDAGSMPNTHLPDDLEPTGIRRRRAVLMTNSLRSLLPKLSKSILRRRASQQECIDDSQSDDRLKVTNFEQTPYSQRCGDTKRNEMSRIRAYLDNVLQESDDEEAILHFYLDVPDHLPNSPLCPLSPKHKSGGKAMCPLHGRKKGVPAKEVLQRVRHGPTIVFDSAEKAYTAEVKIDHAYAFNRT